MTECEFCFCKSGQPHHDKCPVVNQTVEKKINGLRHGTLLDHGRYRVGMTLNHGGFGIAYICKDNKYNRRVVVKEFFPNGYAARNIDESNEVSYSKISSDALFMMQEQFYREYDIMTKAAGPGIPGVYGFFYENNSSYIAMDFIEGITFKNYLLNQKKKPNWKMLTKKFFIPLLGIVNTVHSKGLLHRDISLVNLMITPEEKIVLLDFGAGRDFHEKETVEKLRFANKMYAPIEQTQPEHGFRQGPWTDIFALGTVFYIAITGQYPPMATERPQKAVSSAITYVPDLPAPYDDALLKSLYYYPQYRFQSISAFESALTACLKKSPLQISGKPVISDMIRKILTPR